MIRRSLTVVLAGAFLLAGCGRGDDVPGQPSADERSRIDNVAKKLDDQGTIDTSPDSMVPADEGSVTENGVGSAPANATAPTSNASNAVTGR